MGHGRSLRSFPGSLLLTGLTTIVGSLLWWFLSRGKLKKIERETSKDSIGSKCEQKRPEGSEDASTHSTKPDMTFVRSAPAKLPEESHVRPDETHSTHITPGASHHLSCHGQALWNALDQPRLSDLDKHWEALQDANVLASRDQANRTPLLKAVQRNQQYASRALLAAKSDPCAVGQNGWTVMHYLATDGRDVSFAQELVAARADPNALTLDGMPPLFYALNAGHEDMVNALLQSGAHRDTMARTARRHGGGCIGD